MADVHGLDPEDIDEIAQMCLEDSFENLPTLQLDNSSSDNSEKLRIAHSIKGSSANIGLTGLSQAALELESLLQNNSSDGYQEKLDQLTAELQKFKELMDSE